MNLKEVNDAALSALLSEGSQLVDQLTNQETRSKLVVALRSVIKSLEVDGDGKRYRVHSHTHAVSEWRNVSTADQVLRDRLHNGKWTAEARANMSAAKKAQYGSKGLPESVKAKLSANNKTACKWSPERRARFALKKSEGFRFGPKPGSSVGGKPWSAARKAKFAARKAAGWKPKPRAKGLKRNAKPWTPERVARFAARKAAQK